MCFSPQGEKLWTAAFKASFNEFLVLKGRAGQKILSQPLVPTNNRLVFPLNDKMCVRASIRWRDSFSHFSPTGGVGGQIAESFIMSWHSP